MDEETGQEGKPENTITIREHAYNPGTLNIKVGGTVTWNNEDSDPHTVTSSPTGEEFDSGSMSEGQSFAYTFNAPGDFDYHCSIHPTMIGRITVSEQDQL